MTTLATVGKLDHSSLALVRSVERGLPLGVVEDLAQSIAPGDTRFRHSLVPRSTLARRRGAASGRLTAEQGDKIVRVARLWSRAGRVWKSDEAARAFLRRPHPLLDGATPLDVALGTTTGARLVEDILGRLEHGTAV